MFSLMYKCRNVNSPRNVARANRVMAVVSRSRLSFVWSDSAPVKSLSTVSTPFPICNGMNSWNIDAAVSAMSPMTSNQ